MWLPLKRRFGGCGHGFRRFSRFGGFSAFEVYLKGFLVSLTLLLNVLYLGPSYPLRYNCLKDEPEISRKTIFAPRYLQYGVIGDRVFF